MEKLKMQTPDGTEANIEQIAALFPHVVTETRDDKGTVKKTIDFDLLRQALSKEIIDGADERYRLDWPGKKAALLKANTPINKTLRPCREESVNFDTTENLYIEGDNFEVLKVLQESYLGKVKMIYIDPPYNTGNDFIYQDNFTKSKADYEGELGIEDEEGGKLIRNTDSNGRFHSDWLSMMYERLLIARQLLREDGVIFISIDDNEVHNLRKICDEVFGEENFVANFLWKKKGTTSNVVGAEVSSLADNTLSYKKSDSARIKSRETPKESRSYPNADIEGKYRTTVIEKKDSGSYKRESMKFEILGHKPREGKRWQIGQETALILDAKNRFIWDGEKVILKIYDFEDKDTYSAQPNLLFDHGSTDSAATLIKELFDGIEELFDNPKPIELLKELIIFTTSSDDLILDFFSGSATTAHAVMQLNAEEFQVLSYKKEVKEDRKVGRRKFIMVQIPEACDPKSEAFNAGYKTIAEIGKERIRRAGKKIVESYKLEVTREESEVLSYKLEVTREEKEEMLKYGCIKLSESDRMAESNGLNSGSLSTGKKIAERRDLFSFGSDEESGGVDSVEYRGGKRTTDSGGVSTIPSNSQGFSSGTGDATSNMHKGQLPCPYGYKSNDATIDRDKQNAHCPHENTLNCHLVTCNSKLKTPPTPLDIGFRVFKADSSNMKDVHYHPSQLKQEELDFHTTNIKEDRTAEDLLTQVLLDLGLELSLPIEKKTLSDNTVFFVQTNALVACFDSAVDFSIVDTIAQTRPLKVVFKDASFRNDKDRINVTERFKRLSPETKVTVI